MILAPESTQLLTGQPGYGRKTCSEQQKVDDRIGITLGQPRSNIAISPFHPIVPDRLQFPRIDRTQFRWDSFSHRFQNWFRIVEWYVTDVGGLRGSKQSSDGCADHAGRLQERPSTSFDRDHGAKYMLPHRVCA